jgi:hypothetical protein
MTKTEKVAALFEKLVDAYMAKLGNIEEVDAATLTSATAFLKYTGVDCLGEKNPKVQSLTERVDAVLPFPRKAQA